MPTFHRESNLLFFLSLSLFYLCTDQARLCAYLKYGKLPNREEKWQRSFALHIDHVLPFLASTRSLPWSIEQ